MHSHTQLGPAELFMYVCLKVPFAVSRDACVHAYAADCLHENGKILLLGNSVEHEIGEVKGMSERGSGHERSLWEWQWERQEQERLQRIHQEGIEGAAESPSVPPPHVLPRSTTIYDNNSILRKVISHCPESACPWMTYGWGSSRMTISEYIAIIEVTGPESARPVIIAKVDPNMGRFIPQWLLNSLIKNLAGVLLHYFQKQVQNVAAFNQLNPTTQAKTKKSDIQTLGTASPESLAKHRAFYCDWLVPKLRTYGRYMNWTLQDIACLGIDGRMSLEDSPIDKNDTKVTHDVTDVHVSTEGTSEGDVKMPIPSAT